MKKYAGLIILIILQLITMFLFRNLELDTVVGLWTVVYLYMFSKRFFKLGDMATGNMGDIYIRNNVENKVSEYSKKSPMFLKNLNTKWFYLALTLINAVATYLLIKG